MCSGFKGEIVYDDNRYCMHREYQVSGTFSYNFTIENINS